MTLILILLYLLLPCDLYPNEIPKKINIIGHSNEAPYLFIDENNKPNGFSLELITLILNDLNVSYEISIINSQAHREILNKIKNNELILNNNDLLISIPLDTIVESDYFYSKPYHSRTFDIIRHKDSVYSKSANIYNKELIVRRWSHEHRKLRNIGEDKFKKIVTVNDTYSGIKLLGSGHCDYLICESNESDLHDKMKSEYNLISSKSNIPTLDYYYLSANKKLIDSINLRLNSFKNTGQHDKLVNKWISVNKPLITDKILLVIISLLTIAGLIVSLFSMMLRKKVKSATQKQENTIESLKLAINSAKLIRWRYYVKKGIVNITDSNLNEYKTSFREYFDYIHHEDSNEFRQYISDILDGKKRESLTIRINLNSQEYIPYEIHSILKYDNYGNPDAIQGISVNVSRLYNYQVLLNEKISQLKETNAKLESSNKVLEENESNLKIILNKIPVPVLIKNTITQKYDYVNEEANNTFNVNHKENINDIISIKDIIYNNKINNNIVKSGEDYSAYEQITLTNGKTIDTLVKKTIIEQNNIKKILIVRLDVTEQKKSSIAQKILSSSLESFKAYTWHIDLRSNRIIYDEFVISSKNNIYKLYNFDLLIKAMHPDDQQNFRSEINNIINNNISQTSIFYRIDIDNDNNYEWWESRMIIETLKDKNTEYKVLYGINININETKTNEIYLENSRKELYRLNKQNNIILNNINSALIYFNSNYEIIWSNAETVLGDIGKKFYQVGNKCIKESKFKDNACHNCPVSAAIAKKEVCNSELRYDDNGVYEATAIPIYDNNGTFEGIVLKIDDITDRHNMIKDITLAKEKAEESEKMKGVFLANMSHEIRTPLNAILGFSQCLLYSNTPEENESYMDIINRNSDLLLRIIDNILDLSKLESGIISREVDHYDIVSLFDDTFTSFQAQNNSNIIFRKENNIETQLINFETSRVEQLMNNFISNAFKYTKTGEIIMSLERFDNGIKFSVRDTGVGIDKKYHNLIFNRFEKLNSFEQGSGLGLAICKAIVNSMSGKIGFESEPNKGSFFWAWFPLT